jgi:hypothetical protein
MYSSGLIILGIALSGFLHLGWWSALAWAAIFIVRLDIQHSFSRLPLARAIVNRVFTTLYVAAVTTGAFMLGRIAARLFHH